MGAVARKQQARLLDGFAKRLLAKNLDAFWLYF